MNQNKSDHRIHSLDLLRCVFALMVCYIHSYSGDGQSAIISRIAVPGFFMISGFFIANTAKRGGVQRYLKRMLCMTVLAMLLYLMFNFLRNIDNVSLYIMACFNAKTLFETFILCNVDSNFGGHLWYMVSLIWSVLVFSFLYKRRGFLAMKILTVAGLGALIVFGKYSLLILGIDMPTYYTKNWFCVGFPFLYLGYEIHEHKENYLVRINTGMNFALLIAAYLLCFAERYTLLNMGLYAKRDFYIGTILLTWMLILLAVRYPDFGEKSIIESIGRELSTGIYIIHMLVLTVISKCLAVAVDRIPVLNMLYPFAFILVFFTSMIIVFSWKKLKPIILSSI